MGGSKGFFKDQGVQGKLKKVYIMVSMMHFWVLLEYPRANLSEILTEKQLIVQAFDVPFFFFIISYRLRAIKTLYFFIFVNL